MPHHCPFPVRSTDARCSYRTGTAPGFALTLALLAVLSGYASLSDAALPAWAQDPASDGAAIGWAKDRLLAVPCAGLSDKACPQP
jgi:hypothetical protein